MKWFLVLSCLLFGQAAYGWGVVGHAVSEKNSTTTPLGIGGTFTGEWEICYDHEVISFAINTDQDTDVQLQFSSDGVNTDSTVSYEYKSSVGFEPPHQLSILRKYCRIYLSNSSGVAQTYLRLQVIYRGGSGITVSPLSSTLSQDADAIPTRPMDFESMVVAGLVEGWSIVQKFGRNDAVTTLEDVWHGGSVYTGFPTGTPELVEVLSGSSDDDEGGTGCEKVRIFGLDASGVMQDEVVTLNGTAAVDSVGTYSRVYRAYCTQSANGANTAFNAGDITVRHTTTTANVFVIIPTGFGQSQVACYTIPAGHTGYLKHVEFELRRSNSATIDGALWIRHDGFSPRLIRINSAGQTSPYSLNIYGGIVLPALTDICARVTAVSAGTNQVIASYDILLRED